MGTESNPQAEQMADESMVRCLVAQAEAIWPQEERLFERYSLPAGARVLDVGCGTGELCARVAELWPDVHVTGIDLIEEHLSRARARCAQHSDRVEFLQRDALDLGFEDGSFDLVVCRHLLQAVPTPERVIDGLVRVTRAGGRVHLLAEDYAMMHFHPTAQDADEFWHRGPIRFAERTRTDLRIGRKCFTHLSRAGLEDLTVDYVTVDTTRVPRETFAAIWTAWRDGYSAAIASETELSLREVRAHFDDMLACIRDPHGYAVWQIPIVAGRVPAGTS